VSWLLYIHYPEAKLTQFIFQNQELYALLHKFNLFYRNLHAFIKPSSLCTCRLKVLINSTAKMHKLTSEIKTLVLPLVSFCSRNASEVLHELCALNEVETAKMN